jgi:hypothetical protein
VEGIILPPVPPYEGGTPIPEKEQVIRGKRGGGKPTLLAVSGSRVAGWEKITLKGGDEG